MAVSPRRISCVAGVILAFGGSAALAQGTKILPCKSEQDPGPCIAAQQGPFKGEQPKPGLSAQVVDKYIVVSWAGPAKEVTMNGIDFEDPLPVVAPNLRQVVIQYADAATTKSAIPLNVLHADGKRTVERVDLFGPQANPEPGSTPVPAEKMDFAGTGLSAHIWLPKDYQAGRRYPIVYVAHSGGNRGELAAEQVRKGKLAPVIVVGVDVCTKSNPDRRCTSKYIYMDQPRAGVTRKGFVEYEKFFVHTVVPQVEAKYGAPMDASQRAVAGESNGGAWAATVVMRNPELFGRAIAMSPGGANLYDPLEKHPKAVFAMSGGALEPGFSSHARCFAGRVVDAGGTATLRIYPSGHSRLMWEEEFVQAMLDWLGTPASPLKLAPGRPKWCPEKWGA